VCREPSYASNCCTRPMLVNCTRPMLQFAGNCPTLQSAHILCFELLHTSYAYKLHTSHASVCRELCCFLPAQLYFIATCLAHNYLLSLFHSSALSVCPWCPRARLVSNWLLGDMTAEHNGEQLIAKWHGEAPCHRNAILNAHRKQLRPPENGSPCFLNCLDCITTELEEPSRDHPFKHGAEPCKVSS